MANEDYSPDDREDQILEVIKEGREEGGPWGRVNPKYVSEELDIRRQYVNDALGDLVTAGWLRKPVTGLYEFVDDPRED